MASYTLKLFRSHPETGYLILTNGKVGALRRYPFSTNSYELSAITGYDGAYQVANITESGIYKLFVGENLNNLVEEKSWGGDNGIPINVDDNNWTFDHINSVYLTNSDYNVLIGASGSDVNKLALLGDVSITGSQTITENLKVNGTISAGSMYFVSTTAHVAELSVTSQALNFLGSVSITGDGIPPIESHLLKVHQPNNVDPSFIVTSAGNVNVTNNISASAFYLNDRAIVNDIPVISPPFNTNDLIISSEMYDDTNLLLKGFQGRSSIQLADNQIRMFGGVDCNGSLYADVFTCSEVNTGSVFATNIYASNLSALTASLSGGSVLSKTGSQIYLTTSSNNLRLGNSTLTGMKLDVQGQSNFGNTVLIGSVGEKGRITWGGNPQALSLFALSSLDVTIGTNGSGEIIRGTSAGNVGINTSSPQQKLDVNGAVNFRSALFFGLIGEKGTLTFNTNDFIVRANPNHNLQLGTNFTNVITVASSYNVGINTSSPSATLHLKSTLDYPVIIESSNALYSGFQLRATSISAKPYVELNNSANNKYWGIISDPILDTFAIYNSGSVTQRLTVNSLGNIGIGTTNPQSRLSISGNSSITGSLDLIGASNKIQFDANTLSTGDIPAGASFWNYGGNFTLLGNPQGTAGHKFTICSFGGGGIGWRSMLETANSNVEPTLILAKRGGFIGVGTDTPTQKLSVSGNINLTGNLISSTATDIGLFALSTGRIGINTSSPTVALEVSGSLVGGQSFSLGKAPNAAIGFAFNRHFPTGAIYDSTRYAFQFTRPSNADRFALEVYNGSGTLITANAITVDAVGNFGILTNAPTTALDINANTMRLRSSRTITNSNDPGNTGDHCWDSNYLYVCTATNTWKRAALSSW
jgi:hypothetical protein